MASFWLPRWEAPPAGQLVASRLIPGRLGPATELKIDRLFLGSVGFRESFAWRFAAGGEGAEGGEGPDADLVIQDGAFVKVNR